MSTIVVGIDGSDTSLGSVGHQCVQHSACPVVIVPRAARATRA
ncbi:MAG: hypothetical protein WD646_05290 [Actinomycetota bacterium]